MVLRSAPCTPVSSKFTYVKLTGNALIALERAFALASRDGGGWNEQTRQGQTPKS